MYHTEGYIDRESVDSGSHMISLAGKLQGRDVLVWAVWRESSRARQSQERLRQWLVGELGAAGSVSSGQINREMLRISSALKCRLYLYYDKKLYRAGEQAAEGEYYIGPSLGVYVHREGGTEKFTGEHINEKDDTGEWPELCGEDNRRGEWPELCGEDNRRGECCPGLHANGNEEAGNFSLVEKLGNIWQKNIMDCVMEDSLSYAYFMLWEVR